MRLFILALAAVALALLAGSAFATPDYLVKADGSPAYDYGVPGDGAYYSDSMNSGYIAGTSGSLAYNYGSLGDWDHYRNYLAYYKSYYTYTTPNYGRYGYMGYPRATSYLSAPAIPSFYWNFDTYNMPWQRYGYNTPYVYGSVRPYDYFSYSSPCVYAQYSPGIYGEASDGGYVYSSPSVQFEYYG